MKRIAITILSVIIGLFGYTVVDTAIESRVSSLEDRVSYLENVVESYHKVITQVVTIKHTSSLTTVESTTEDKLVDNVIGEGGNQIAGYRYNSAGDFYYTDDKDCWQKNAGYNEVYDNMAPMAGMFIDQVRIHFNYGDKDWMIQFWKGQYGFLLVGAEIGVYTAPGGTYKGDTSGVNHYSCAGQEDWLNMQLDCYWSKNNNGHYEKIFTREYGKYWWATGFVKGQLTKYTIPKTELKVKGRITFKSKEMADLFVYGLRDSGFVRAAASNQLVDDSYYQSGADVWVLWSTIYHDCFVKEDGEVVTTKATTKATTTKAPATTVKVTEIPTVTASENTSISRVEFSNGYTLT